MHLLFDCRPLSESSSLEHVLSSYYCETQFTASAYDCTTRPHKDFRLEIQERIDAIRQAMQEVKERCRNEGCLGYAPQCVWLI